MAHADDIGEAIFETRINKVPELFVTPVVFRGRFKNDRQITRIDDFAGCDFLGIAVFIMGKAVRASGEEAFDMVVPAMKIRGFNFTEVTKF